MFKALIYSRKGMWKGKLALAKALGKEAEKYFVLRSAFLSSLMHREHTKSFSLIPA